MNVLGLGVFMLVFGVKTGSIKVDDNLKKSVCGKNVKLCDHKSGCNDFLNKEIRVPAQNAVVLLNLKLTCGRVLRQNEKKKTCKQHWDLMSRRTGCVIREFKLHVYGKRQIQVENFSK